MFRGAYWILRARRGMDLPGAFHEEAPLLRLSRPGICGIRRSVSGKERRTPYNSGEEFWIRRMR